MTRRGRQQTTWLAVAFVAASVVFTVWPGIDLWVSGLFYVEGRGFPLGDNLVIGGVRHALRIIMTLTPVVTLVLMMAGPLGFRPWHIPGPVLGFVTLLFLIGPLLIVNVGFKDWWGRARPEQIVEFGGEAAFTPALRVAHECARNCSFVSGEGAGATALAIAMLVLAPYVLAGLREQRRKRVLGWALLAPAVAIVLRVATGRHFLSDTVFAILIVLLLAAILYPVIVSPSQRQRNPHR